MPSQHTLTSRHLIPSLKSTGEITLSKLVSELNTNLYKLEELQNKPSRPCLEAAQNAVSETNQKIRRRLAMLKESHIHIATLDFARIQKNIKQLLTSSQQILNN